MIVTCGLGFWRTFPFMSKFTHISEIDVENAVERLRAGREIIDLNEAQLDELSALEWYGRSPNGGKADFSWHYKHYLAGKNVIQANLSPENLGKGMDLMRAEK